MLTEVKKKIAEALEKLVDRSVGEIMPLLERPKNSEHGQLALPVFSWAKEQKKAPPIIAKELEEKLSAANLNGVEKVEAAGGFVNFKFTGDFLSEVLFRSLNTQSDKIGFSDRGAGKTIAIDFSSPNVAKPMSIGHLRATVIGQAICNLSRSQGYEVIGINHLGDWGVQFGKLAWAYLEWGKDYPFQEKPFEALFDLYVRFHSEAETNPVLNEKGSATFKRLEEGDSEIQKIWKMFIEISLKEYQRLWDILGVRHDLVRGESFYNDRLKPTEKMLEDKGLLIESDGAMVVPMDDPKMPPCLIRKSDGASLYATRDVASAIYRMEELKADLNLYVVGVDQTLHFKQVFEVVRKMGYPWTNNCHHISFGMYRFKDGRMSTRKGNVVFLEDVLMKGIESVRQIIEEKNPGLQNKDEVATQVGVGAIIFNDLMNDRVKNVDFDWDRVLDFEGNSGPYVQYTAVRCRSILRKSSLEPDMKASHVLSSADELQLMAQLLHFEDILRLAFQSFKPHLLAGYLLDLCRQFSQFYSKHRILGEQDEVARARLSLVKACEQIIVQGLKVLNIETPEAM